MDGDTGTNNIRAAADRAKNKEFDGQLDGCVRRDRLHELVSGLGMSHASLEWRCALQSPYPYALPVPLMQLELPVSLLVGRDRLVD